MYVIIIRIQPFTLAGIGFPYGKRVIVRLPTDVFVAGVNQILADGVAIKLAEQHRGVGSDLLFLPTGVHALVTLKATAYEFMNDPPRYRCSHTSNSHLLCFEQCLTAPAELECNCSLVASGWRRFEYCTWYQISTCIYQAVSAANVTECRARCPPPCSYVDYQASITYATFPPSHLSEFLEAEDDVDVAALNKHIILEVFFENMEMLFIKHVVSLTPFSFVAQIGGQVSLWMGASILTCVQLAVFIAQFINYRLQAIIRSSSASSSSSSGCMSPVDGEPVVDGCAKPIVIASSSNGAVTHRHRQPHNHRQHEQHRHSHHDDYEQPAAAAADDDDDDDSHSQHSSSAQSFNF